ncbi:MAG TPA: RNA polymerase sigma factor [Candidatus Limnocylindria bacterium]|nr:RNA polymerase sigma factor [Candidatus Limnocylindria bacterium]
MRAFAFASLGSHDRAAAGVAEAGVISDAQLLALAAESQRDALDALYGAYKSRIYTFLLRFLADPELADDVTQECFTKAFTALPKLERGTKVLPWLYRVASNTAIDHLRRRKRFIWVRMGAMQDTPHEPRSADASAGVGEREHVQAVLRTLPPENAVALLLHALEGYSYKEIAEIQGASLTAVRSRIARARSAFKAGYATKDPA